MANDLETQNDEKLLEKVDYNEQEAEKLDVREKDEGVEKSEEKDFEFEFGDFKETPEVEEKDIKLSKIKKQYPNLFDEYPALRSNFFLANEYRRIFPNVEAARTGADRLKVLDAIEQDIFGNASFKELLTRIEKGDKAVFQKVITNLLEDIRSISVEDYLRAAQPALDELIVNLNTTGEQHSDPEQGANIKNAALLVNMFLYGHRGLPRGVRSRATVEHKQEDKKEIEFGQRKLESSRQQVLKNVLEVLDKNLQKMYPEGKYKNKFLRSSIIKEVRTAVIDRVSEDEVHVGNMTALWKKAVQQDFDSDILSRITHTMLQKISQVLPKVKAQVETEAGDEPVETESKGDEEFTPKSKRPAKEIDWKRTTPEQYLNGRIKYKGEK